MTNKHFDPENLTNLYSFYLRIQSIPRRMKRRLKAGYLAFFYPDSKIIEVQAIELPKHIDEITINGEGNGGFNRGDIISFSGTSRTLRVEAIALKVSNSR